MSRFDAARLAAIDARMAEWVAADRYERLEWLVGDSTGVVHRGATGEAALYRIWSMTKPIVSIAALQLIEEGRLQLFHPVSLYLPEYAELWVKTPAGLRRPQTRMTVHHLLTHTAGLSYNFMTDAAGAALNAMDVNMPPLIPLREEAKRIAQAPLVAEPGTGWTYSVATDVLAALLEVVEQKPLAEILRDRVFAPLGMAETGFRPGAAAAARIAPSRGGLPGLLNAETVGATYPHDDPGFARGGHGLFSTLEDYAAFAGALLRTARGAATARVIGAEMLAHATRNHVAALMPIRLELHPAAVNPGVAGQGFGLGFSVAQPGAPVVSRPGAFGWSGAAETWFTVDPAADLFMVFMGQNFDWPGACFDLQAMGYSTLAG